MSLGAVKPARRFVTLLSLAAVVALGDVHAAAAQITPTDQEAQSGANVARDLAMLKGKWMRRDGNYTIDIKSIDPSGKIAATYFNPNPVDIVKAQASTEDGALNLFVELQGPRYSGSTYTLVYDPKCDCLLGIYFHAVTQQKFAVIFQRGQ
jgi:uncharacterized protein (DUF2147 family)